MQNKNLTILLILAIDFLVFYFSLAIVLLLRMNNTFFESFREHALPFFFLFLIYEAVIFFMGIWDRNFLPSRKNLFNLLAVAQIISLFFMSIFFYSFPVFYIAPKTNLIIFSIFLFIFIFLWKSFFYPRLFGKNSKRALLLDENFSLTEKLEDSLWNIKVVEKADGGFSAEKIKKYISENKVDVIIINLETFGDLEKIYSVFLDGVEILDSNFLEEELEEKISLKKIDKKWIIKNINNGPQNEFLIRLIDLFLAVPVLIIFLLVYPFVALVIKMDDGGRAMVSLERVGRFNKIFYLKKFRSMPEKIKEGERRITKVGKFLRKSSLDELPQVLSIIKGEMSFIGPRPENLSYVKKYENLIPYYNMRHLVSPGISGWAQIRQKEAPHHALDVDLTAEKLEYDLYYLKNRTLFMYLKIVFRTVLVIFNRKNYD